MVQISEGINPTAFLRPRNCPGRLETERKQRERRFREFVLSLPSTRRAWKWRHVSTVYAPFYRVVDAPATVNARCAQSWIFHGWIIEEYLADVGYRAQITSLGREVLRRAA